MAANCYGDLAMGKGITIRLEGEMATRVDDEDYHEIAQLLNLIMENVAIKRS